MLQTNTGSRMMNIEISRDKTLFKLNTAHTSYVMGADPKSGRFEHVYYGPAVSGAPEEFREVIDNPPGISFCPYREDLEYKNSPNVTMQEYTGSEIGDYRISSVSVRNADGTACVDPRFVSFRKYKGKPMPEGLPGARVNGDENVETLEVTLEDPFSGLEILLFYTVFPEQDVIVRSAKFVNAGKKPLILTKAASVCLDLPRRDLDLVQLAGAYFRERFEERTPLHTGLQSIMSRRTSSGHDSNPAFALASHGATETEGEVYGGLLVYSGSFSIEIEVDPYRKTRIAAGIGAENFSWKLEKNASFQTPEAFLTFSDAGLEGMMHHFHDMIREHLVDPTWARAKRPILVNNWEATYFNFDRKKLLSIAKDAADLGIEMLVLDDGWFGHRDNDRSSLGDWFVYKEKIGSLKTLVKEINALGLKFGLWFEPEMISEDSELYRAHPDWVFTVPGRPRSLGRNQMTLDLGRSEVVDYLFDTISDVLKSANIEYIKWDMNRQPAEKYSIGLPADRQLEAGHRYVLGVYELHRRILEAFPHLFIEGCSGGGGRFDAGLLYYTPQIWTSDNTDAIERLRIQGGTSLFYPCSTQGAHVSVCPNHATGRITPFETRGYVALAGSFGYELDLNKLSEEDRRTVRKQCRMYHKFRHLVSEGDYFRLIPAGSDPACAAWEFAAKDRSEVLVCFVQQRGEFSQGQRFLRLRGLDPEAQYECAELGKIRRGAVLMNMGLLMPVLSPGDGVSAMYHFTQVNSFRKNKSKGKNK